MAARSTRPNGANGSKSEPYLVDVEVVKSPVAKASTISAFMREKSAPVYGSMDDSTMSSQTDGIVHARERPRRSADDNQSAGGVLDESFGMDWSHNAVNSSHMWGEREHARENCYVCGDGRTRGLFLKCFACKVIVHESCTDELSSSGLQCRPTFREFTTSTCAEDFIHRHHWVNQRRPSGKCAGCGKTFKDKFPFASAAGKEFVGVGCSWCKLLYHNNCFRFQLIEEPCTLGEFSSLILPPASIVRLPRFDEPSKRRKSMKRRSRRSKEQRFFTIQPQKAAQKRPLLVFVNPKSGGNQGAKIMSKFIWLLNPRQVFNLLDGGPQFALRLWARVQRARILICGGDGTVGWVLSIIDQLKIRPCPPIAILPIGTGNDLARTLYWGGGYQDESLQRILHQVDDAAVIHLDRWDLKLTPITSAGAAAYGEDEDATNVSEQLPLSVMNNYFSMGADALVVLDFHESREAKPERFNSRWFNLMFYAQAGGKEIVERKLKDLFKHVDVVADGVDLTPRIREGKVAAVAFINISRYSAGTQPWGVPGADCEFGPSAPDDGRFEVIGFTTPMLATLHMGSHGIRLAQCTEAVITTSRVIPVQVDGEPCRLAPSHIVISLRNQACMLQRIKRKERGGVPVLTTETADGGRYAAVEHRFQQSDQALLEGEFEVVHRSSTSSSSAEAVIEPHSRTGVGRVGHRNKRSPSPRMPVSATASGVFPFIGVSRSANSSPHGSPSPEVFRQKRLSRSNNSLDAALPHLVPPTRGDALRASDSCPLEASKTPAKETPNSLSVDYNGGESQSLHMAGTVSQKARVPRGQSRHILDLVDDPLTMPSPAAGKDVGDARCISASSASSPGVLSSQQSSDSDGVFNGEVQSALFNACRQGNLYGVIHSLNLGASLLESDEDGLTALHHSARHNRKQIVSHILRLIPRSAVDATDTVQQQTPLHKATWHGYPEVCQLLVEAGASLMAADANGQTPYMLSLCDGGDLELQKFLAACEQRQRIKEDPSETAV